MIFFIFFRHSTTGSLKGMTAQNTALRDTWKAYSIDEVFYENGKEVLRTSDNILSMASDEHYLWLGTSGGIVRRSLKNMEEREGLTNLPSPDIKDLMIDKNTGYIWFVTSEGAGRIDDKGTSWYFKRGFEVDGKTFFQSYLSLWVSDRGDIFFGGENEILRMDQSGKFTSYVLEPKITAEQDLAAQGVQTKEPESFFEDSTGRTLKCDSVKSILKSQKATAIFSDGKGSFWYGGPLFHVDENDRIDAYTQEDGHLSHNSVSSLTPDKDEGLWVGTMFNGAVYMTREKKFEQYTEGNSPIPSKHVIDIKTGSHGDVWIATNQYSSKIDSSGNWTVYNEHNSILTGETIKAMDIDANGRVWFAAKKRLLCFIPAGADIPPGWIEDGSVQSGTDIPPVWTEEETVHYAIDGISTEGHPWSHPYGNSSRSNSSVYSGPRTSNVEWTYESDLVISAAATVSSEGIVYIGGKNKNGVDELHAVNPDGTMQWKLEHINIGRGAAIGPQGEVYGSYTGDKKGIASVSMEGKIKWVNHPELLGADLMVSPEGTVYAVRESVLYAIADNGKLKWKTQLDARIKSEGFCAMGSGGDIYVQLIPSVSVTSVSSSGEYLWRGEVSMDAPLGGASHTPSLSVLQDDTVMVGDDIGILHFFKNGINHGHYVSGQNGIRTPPAAGPDYTLYVKTIGLSLKDVIPKTLNRIFVDEKLNTAISCTAAEPDEVFGNLVAAFEYGRVRDFNWTRRISPTSSSPVADCEGYVYILTGDRVCSFSPEGNEVWTYPLSGLQGSRVGPAIGGNGSLYVTTSEGKLYSFRDKEPEQHKKTVQSIDKGTWIYVPSNPYAGEKLVLDPAGECVWHVSVDGAYRYSLDNPLEYQFINEENSYLYDSFIINILPDGKGNAWICSRKGAVLLDKDLHPLQKTGEFDGFIENYGLSSEGVLHYCANNAYRFNRGKWEITENLNAIKQKAGIDGKQPVITWISDDAVMYLYDFEAYDICTDENMEKGRRKYTIYRYDLQKGVGHRLTEEETNSLTGWTDETGGFWKPVHVNYAWNNTDLALMDGLDYYSPDGGITRYSRQQGNMDVHVINDILMDGQRTWFATPSGLVLMENNTELFCINPENQGIPSGRIRKLLQDDRGRIWCMLPTGVGVYQPEADKY